MTHADLNSMVDQLRRRERCEGVAQRLLTWASSKMLLPARARFFASLTSRTLPFGDGENCALAVMVSRLKDSHH